MPLGIAGSRGLLLLKLFSFQLQLEATTVMFAVVNLFTVALRSMPLVCTLCVDTKPDVCLPT